MTDGRRKSHFDRTSTDNPKKTVFVEEYKKLGELPAENAGGRKKKKKKRLNPPGIAEEGTPQRGEPCWKTGIIKRGKNNNEEREHSRQTKRGKGTRKFEKRKR